MTDPSTPEQPAKTSHRRQLIQLVVGVVLIGTPILLFGMASHSSDDKPSLCDMLRDGWTASEIVDSDQWRDWPDSMSRMERSTTVLQEGERECPKLVGL